VLLDSVLANFAFSRSWRETEKGRSKSMEAIRRWKWAIFAWVLANGLILPAMGPTAPPEASAASAVHCQSVVKKIYSINEGPPFYRAKVLLIHGSVSCAQARKIVWKGLVPGGYFGTIAGWECVPKGMYDPFAVKCARRSPQTGEREVIKSSRPKSCPSCTGNKD
jgi:hypothetical protein